MMYGVQLHNYNSIQYLLHVLHDNNNTVHNDAFFQNFYGATWIGKRRPFFYHFGIAYSPL